MYSFHMDSMYSVHMDSMDSFHMDSIFIPYHSMVYFLFLAEVMQYSIWNPWIDGGIHPFHMDSIWNILGSVKYCPIKIYIVKDTTNSMSKKQITNFCSLKKRTLQTFLVLKSGHYNFCSLKKQTLQTFVILKSGHYNSCSLKKWTLQTFVVLNGRH